MYILNVPMAYPLYNITIMSTHHVDLSIVPQHRDTPLHLAIRGGHVTCVEHLLCTPGIDLNVTGEVS